jgi:hypothetical protein
MTLETQRRGRYTFRMRLLVLACLTAVVCLPPQAAALQESAPPVLVPRVEINLAPTAALAGLSAVRWSGEQAYVGLRPLPELGRGEFGVVYDHPADPTAVVKLVADNKDSIYNTLVGSRSRQEMEADAVSEAQATVALAKAGAGPQLIGVVRVPHRFSAVLAQLASWAGLPAPEWSRPALVKEKVVGQTVEDLKSEGYFGRDEERLVIELKDRLSRAGFASADMKPANIMIGTTASQPVVRAWLVDAGFAELTERESSR